MSVFDRLENLGISLPAAAAPVANYVPYIQTGPLLFISGQVPIENGNVAFQGKVGEDYNTAYAQRAARLCAINIIAQINAATDGDLDRVTRIVKLGGFVNCTVGYSEQPQVINAASDLMVAVFGDAGRHSRSAVGVNALPMNVPVEIDAIVEIR